MANRKTKASEEPELVRRDGVLAVTFANSASPRRKGFASYAELLVWGQRTGTLPAGDAQRLERSARERSDDAAAVAEKALELRASLRRILEALAARKLPAASDLEALNEELESLLPGRRVVPSEEGYRWDWSDKGGDDLDRVLWPVLISAGDLLTTKSHRRVGQCAGETCDLLFVDRGGGSPRKWCSMKECGHPLHSRRYYHQTVRPRRKAIKEKRRRERQKWIQELKGIGRKAE